MDKKRLMEGKNLWLGVLLALAAFSFGAAVPELKQGETFETGTFLKVVAGAFSSKTLLFLFPVVSVLPYGDGYLRDRQSGFIKFLLVRRGRKEYVADKVLTVTLSGVLVWTVAFMAAVFLSFLIFFPMEEKGVVGWAPVWGLLAQLLTACLMGGILANAAGIFAAATNSYYMALGLPFVCYYLLVILNERYLQHLYVLSPKEWLKNEGNWGWQNLGLYLFLLVVLGMFMAVQRAILGIKVERAGG